MNKKKEQDPILLYLIANVHMQIVLDFEKGEYGVLRYQGRLCVPSTRGHQERIMEEVQAPDIPFFEFNKDVPRFERGLYVGKYEEGHC